jgi:hypothetical protein
VRVREREWEALAAVHGVSKYFIIFGGLGFSVTNKKTAKNNIIFGDSYWPSKMTCYIQRFLLFVENLLIVLAANLKRPKFI